jgi:hypothetical protein
MIDRNSPYVMTMMVAVALLLLLGSMVDIVSAADDSGGSSGTFQATPTCDGIEFEWHDLDTMMMMMTGDDVDISRQQDLTTATGSVGAGTWIGVYPATDLFIQSLPDLPAHSTEQLMEWSYVCGSKSDCDFAWPMTGTLLFPSATLWQFMDVDTEYIAVAAVGFTSIAQSQRFKIRSWDSCRIGGNDSMFNYIAQVRTEITNLITQNTQRIGQFLRLVFHDVSITHNNHKKNLLKSTTHILCDFSLT